MSEEKGLLHTLRRKTLGRSPAEIELHELSLKKLKQELNAKTQQTIDDLKMRYDNEDVKQQVVDAHTDNGLEDFLSELNSLQVTVIEAKTRFFEGKQNDELNDLEDIEAEIQLWEKELAEIVEGSTFRKLAERYEVWGHEPVRVQNIKRETHGKVIRLHPGA